MPTSSNSKPAPPAPSRPTPAEARPAPAAAKATEPAKPHPEPVAAKATEPAKPRPEPVVSKTTGPAKPRPEPVAPETPQPAEARPEPVVSKTTEPAKPRTEPVAPKTPQPAEARPEPVVSKTTEPAKPRPQPTAASKATEPAETPVVTGSAPDPQPSPTEKAVEHLMPVKPVELAARAELSQSAVAAEAAAPARTQLVDLSKEHGRKGRKGSRTRPKAAAKRTAKPAGTGPSRDEHSGVPPRGDHHGEHGGRAARAVRHGGAHPGDAAPKPAAAQATALVDEGPGGGTGTGDGEEHGGLTPAQAFDALYAFTAPGLVRQTYLLTGRRALAKEAVERAFHKAWEQWPEVAKDRDPVGWVRAVAYEYALSPWHRFRRSHRHPDAPPAEPEDRKLLDTLLSLPPSYRRTLVLYDGVGLDLPETAAETEASTPAAANRLLHAREAIAEQLPELAEPRELQRRLDELACAEKLGTGKATAVRGEGERRVRFWTRAAIAFTALIIGASAITWITSAKDYEPTPAPGQKVTGVPPRSGPQILDKRDKELQRKLRQEPGAGPERIHPLPE
ncbi:hypothetical protein H9Y04_32395 [Streptomyces sp. TRM66268-LWL]|uniref:Uncharacterized protein n=1 Tax=Streptomyces polyasparticus TaxID=2767826 RepID=A0ABR7SRM1_9ACTN|nr:hypothetical protein [Streptomyces polyasparticus]MBC9717237.1 hypothetical protein [Streptomyces polyasparticus]